MAATLQDILAMQSQIKQGTGGDRQSYFNGEPVYGIGYRKEIVPVKHDLYNDGSALYTDQNTGKAVTADDYGNFYFVADPNTGIADRVDNMLMVPASVYRELQANPTAIPGLFGIQPSGLPHTVEGAAPLEGFGINSIMENYLVPALATAFTGGAFGGGSGIAGMLSGGAGAGFGSGPLAGADMGDFAYGAGADSAGLGGAGVQGATAYPMENYYANAGLSDIGYGAGKVASGLPNGMSVTDGLAYVSDAPDQIGQLIRINELGGPQALGFASNDAAIQSLSQAATAAGPALAAGAGAAVGAAGAGTGTAAGTAAAGTAATGLFGLPKDLSNALTQAGINLGVAGAAQALFGSDDGSAAAKSSADAANTQSQIAREQWDYYKQNYQPVNTALINESMAAGGPEDIARAQGEANAATTQAYDQAQKQMQSRLQSFGLNPASPAYQSAAGSVDLAQGASNVGAQTVAANNARNLGYAKRLDVANLGKGIPSASAAAASSAANTGLNASNLAFNQNQRTMQNVGYGLEPIKNALGKTASTWFDTPQQPTTYGTKEWSDPFDTAFTNTYGYKDGGMVFAPHMKRKAIRYAGGGMVGLDNMHEGATIDNETGEVDGPGTETSDSVPAMIDGEQPAALSSGETVMNTGVRKLSADEILQALNSAGLQKRGDAGIEPQMRPPQQYRRGGRVTRSCGYSEAGLEA